MVTQKLEMIFSAIIGSVLLLQAIFHTTKVISNGRGIIIFTTSMYLAICYLYANKIPSWKHRILMVVVSLSLLTLIISNHFYISAWHWDIVYGILFGIDIVAIVAFFLMIFTHDSWFTFLFTTFVAVTDLIFFTLSHSRPFNVIFTLILSIIGYFILSIFHIKQIYDRRWTVAAITLSFAAILLLGILLRMYWQEKKLLFILFASMDCCLSLIPILCVWAQNLKAWWKIYREKELIKDDPYSFLEMAGLPTRFTLIELSEATENFGAPIGEGASGAVFKGTLADGSTIAVKRIKWQVSGETEFRTEITIIASLQHVNLVHLLGYCLSPQGDHYLIYPFFENGSLDSCLFKDAAKKSRLTWSLRYHIAIDVAKALAYLHHDCHHRILHLDVKPANILLDGNFRALVSDFGISKLIGRDESKVMTRARGTVGYLAPEMLVPNAISTKSDVYSFGMVLMELVSGQRNFMLVVHKESDDRQKWYFPKIAREKLMQGRLMEVVDESLLSNEDMREEQLVVLVRTSLWCIQENPELRPSMAEVVEMLEGRKPVHVPPESPMYIANFLDMLTKSIMVHPAQGDEATVLSANTLSISIQSGR